jgi:very-short-patch-repair endonuclease
MAARVGGVLGCVSAIALHGGWLPEQEPLHVLMPSNGARPRSPDDSSKRLRDGRHDVILHWSGTQGARTIMAPLSAIRQALLCLEPEFASAAIAVLLHERPDLRRQWNRALGSLPHGRTQWVRRIDHICESGTEVLWWFRMQKHHVRLRRQVEIDGIGRVDFLIGERLVVEVDGAEYHTDPAAFEGDRLRDALLSARGFRVLRFSYRMVLDHWPIVEAAVLAAIARGDMY